MFVRLLTNGIYERYDTLFCSLSQIMPETGGSGAQQNTTTNTPERKAESPTATESHPNANPTPTKAGQVPTNETAQEPYQKTEETRALHNMMTKFLSVIQELAKTKSKDTAMNMSETMAALVNQLVLQVKQSAGDKLQSKTMLHEQRKILDRLHGILAGMQDSFQKPNEKVDPDVLTKLKLTGSTLSSLSSFISSFLGDAPTHPPIEQILQEPLQFHRMFLPMYYVQRNVRQVIRPSMMHMWKCIEDHPQQEYHFDIPYPIIERVFEDMHESESDESDPGQILNWYVSRWMQTYLTGDINRLPSTATVQVVNRQPKFIALHGGYLLQIFQDKLGLKFAIRICDR